MFEALSVSHKIQTWRSNLGQDVKKIEMNQAIGILANVGVLGGLLLLAYELRQNNDLMEAEGRFNRLSIVSAAWGSWAVDGDLTELRVRAGKEEELRDFELRRVEGAIMRVFVNLEWIHRELPEGSPERNFTREVQRRNFANDASYRKVWESRKSAFDPGFVEWMEANVVNYDS